MRSVVYCRVSSEPQSHNTSIPDQRDRCTAYVAAQGWELVTVYTEPGVTGSTLDRPALAEVRQAASRGAFDVLVVLALDRLTRDVDNLFELRAEFRRAGVRVVTVRDGLDVTTADLDAMLPVLIGGYVGHRELQTIRARMMGGLDRRIRAGRLPGGRVPYGYTRSHDTHSLEVCNAQAAIVRQVFAWTASGLSTWQIAARLTAAGVPAYAGRQWWPSSVSRILRAEVYHTGAYLYRWQGEVVTFPCPPIVDAATWDAAQRAVARHSTGGRRPTRGEYLLSGLVRCERCGAAYIVKTRRREGGPFRYSCAGRELWKQYHRDAPCAARSISGPDLDAAVWADVADFCRRPETVAEMLQQQRDGSSAAELARTMADTDRALAERRAEESRYLGLYGRGSIPVDLLETQIGQTRRQIEALESYRADLEAERQRADSWQREMAGLVDALAALGAWLDAGRPSFEDRRAVVQALVSGVTVGDTIGVTYRFQRPPVEPPIPIEAAIADWRLAGQNARALWTVRRQIGVR